MRFRRNELICCKGGGGGPGGGSGGSLGGEGIGGNTGGEGPGFGGPGVSGGAPGVSGPGIGPGSAGGNPGLAGASGGQNSGMGSGFGGASGSAGQSLEGQLANDNISITPVSTQVANSTQMSANDTMDAAVSKASESTLTSAITSMVMGITPIGTLGLMGKGFSNAMSVNSAQSDIAAMHGQDVADEAAAHAFQGFAETSDPSNPSSQGPGDPSSPPAGILAQTPNTLSTGVLSQPTEQKAVPYDAKKMTWQGGNRYV